MSEVSVLMNRIGADKYGDRSGMCAVSVGEYIYLIGGEINGEFTDQIIKHHPINGTFELVYKFENKELASHNMEAVFNFYDHILIFNHSTNKIILFNIKVHTVALFDNDMHNIVIDKLDSGNLFDMYFIVEGTYDVNTGRNSTLIYKKGTYMISNNELYVTSTEVLNELTEAFSTVDGEMNGNSSLIGSVKVDNYIYAFGGFGVWPGGGAGNIIKYNIDSKTYERISHTKTIPFYNNSKLTYDEFRKIIYIPNGQSYGNQTQFLEFGTVTDIFGWDLDSYYLEKASPVYHSFNNTFYMFGCVDNDLPPRTYILKDNPVYHFSPQDDSNNPIRIYNETLIPTPAISGSSTSYNQKENEIDKRIKDKFVISDGTTGGLDIEHNKILRKLSDGLGLGGFGEGDGDPVMIAGSALTSGRYGTSCARVGDCVYVFGGRTESGYLNEILKFNTLDNTVTLLNNEYGSGVNNDIGDFTARQYSSAAAVGTDIYIFGGSLSNESNQIIRFDTLNNTAVAINIGTNVFVARQYSSAAAVGTDIYIFGGVAGATSDERQTFKFNTLDNTVTEIFNILRRRYTSAAAVGTDIYIFGGRSYTWDDNTSIIKFDTLTDTVSNYGKITGDKEYTSAAAVGTDIYIFGGETDSGTIQNYIHRFNTLDGTISLIGYLPTARSSTSAAAVGTDIYIFGGKYNDTQRSDILNYNVKTNTCTDIIKKLPTPVKFHTSQLVGNYIYTFGGINSSGSILNTITKYDINAGRQIYNETNEAFNRYSMASVKIGTNIYILGGWNSDLTGTSNIVKFDTLTDTVDVMSVEYHNTTSGLAAAVGTDIYIFHDLDNWIYKFDTLTKTAIRVDGANTSAFTYRIGATAAVVGTDIYIFGGLVNGVVVSNQIIKFDTLTNTATDVSGPLTEDFTGSVYPSSTTIGTDVYVFGGISSPYTHNNIIKFNTLSNTATRVNDDIINGSTFTARYGTTTVSSGTDIFILGGNTSSNETNTANNIDQILKLKTNKNYNKLHMFNGRLCINEKPIATENDLPTYMIEKLNSY